MPAAVTPHTLSLANPSGSRAPLPDMPSRCRPIAANLRCRSIVAHAKRTTISGWRPQYRSLTVSTRKRLRFRLLIPQPKLIAAGESLSDVVVRP